jgi:hypothetical protein
MTDMSSVTVGQQMRAKASFRALCLAGMGHECLGNLSHSMKCGPEGCAAPPSPRFEHVCLNAPRNALALLPVPALERWGRPRGRDTQRSKTADTR